MKRIWKNRYQLVEKLGKGGTGQVYKIRDIHLEKEWALKMLDSNFMTKKQEAEEKQWEEFSTLKKLNHPNFPRIVDAFEENGKKILVMDYIQGITLEEMIRKGPLEEKNILLIAKQICEAVLYLHHLTPVLLYLDLKPSNIIIDEKGTVKLVDLGSVRKKGEVGIVSGSFGFASPEQIKVQKDGILLTEQSDIFSFGMILYAMALGNTEKLPIIEEKCRHGVFIRKINPYLPVELEKMIEKCTRGNFQKRYSSMREIKSDLICWEKEMGSKRKIKTGLFYGFFKGRKQWYQERSIFCTDGKPSFYIAKKLM